MLSMSPSKRRDTDMMKLMMSDFEVHIPDESSMHDFLVAFPGPEDTPYTGGIWKVHVTLPKEYPFKSPSIGFENRMFHPNVDEMSGSVCLDVINQTWSPMFDLVNIFKLFIPQLLSYPNPTDPLNGEAAALLMRDPEAYAGRIRDCVRLYASDPVHLDGSPVIVAAATSNPNNPAANDPNTNNPAANNPTANNPNTNNPNTSNPNTNNASASSSSGGGGSSSSSDGVSAGANASASAIASAIGIGGGGGGSSGGRSNSIGSDTSGMSGMSGMSGISASSDESESSSEDNKPSAADGANADARGGGDNRRENDCEGGEDTTMGEGGGKAGDVKRRDSTAGNNNGGGENSCRSSSSSEFMMEMDMDETASDVSALSDVDG